MSHRRKTREDIAVQSLVAGFLKARRHHYGASQREMCEYLGISQNTFSRWENGEHIPTLYQLRRWAIGLGLTGLEEVMRELGL